jgi:hypothetical protein
LSGSELPRSPNQLLQELLAYVDQTSGLVPSAMESGLVRLTQQIDKKEFVFNVSELTEVLHRSDNDGKGFLQVNFRSGKKVLLTDTLVGFKPMETLGLDLSRIPKVVTTPDLQSVFEAIEDCLASEMLNGAEYEILRKVFLSILGGAEGVGFRLQAERTWIGRLVPTNYRATA